MLNRVALLIMAMDNYFLELTHLHLAESAMKNMGVDLIILGVKVFVLVAL